MRDIEKLGRKGFAAANGYVEARPDLDSNRAGSQPTSAISTFWSTMRGSRRTTWRRMSREKDFDRDARGQFEGYVFRQPGRRAGHDPPEIWPHHQHEFAGRVCRAADRVSYCMTKAAIAHLTEMPCSRMGQVQHHGQRRCANIHSHARNRRVSCRTANPRRYSNASPPCTALANPWKWQVQSYSCF